MKTVLLVDDDPLFIELHAREFAALRTQYELLTSSNGHEAIGILETKIVDLLVTDLQMPVMDGFELLTRALSLQPNLSLLVLSEVETEYLELALETPGTTEVLKKPLASGAPLERTRAIFARRTRGHLSGLSLAGFLQLLHLEGRSCALTVRSGSLIGTIDLFDGELLDASTRTRRGSTAFMEILSWRHPDIEMVGTFKETHRGLDGSLEGLLIEAARITDESRRDNSPSLSSQWIAGAGDGRSTLPPIDLRPKQKETLQRLLHRVLMLEGALGVALVDTRSGLSLLSETRRLQAEFEESAAHLTSLMRARKHFMSPSSEEPEIQRLVLEHQEEVELWTGIGPHHLALYYLGRVDGVPLSEIQATLDRIGGKIDSALASPASSPGALAASTTGVEPKEGSGPVDMSGIGKTAVHDPDLLASDGPRSTVPSALLVDASEVAVEDSVLEEDDAVPPLPASQN